jgi:hypothetical protein
MIPKPTSRLTGNITRLPAYISAKAARRPNRSNNGPYPLLGGRYQVDGMPVVVSRGADTWGLRMRLWWPSEIARIKHQGDARRANLNRDGVWSKRLKEAFRKHLRRGAGSGL